MAKGKSAQPKRFDTGGKKAKGNGGPKGVATAASTAAAGYRPKC